MQLAINTLTENLSHILRLIKHTLTTNGHPRNTQVQ